MTTDAAASLSRTAREALAAFAAYSFVAFLYFGLRPLIEPGSQYVGVFNDPQIFIWSFAWWLHAIEHFQDPFVTHAVWAPTGLNLAWVTTVPALSLVFAPLTALAGPVASYDIAAVLMPALSAWTAYLLCRHLTSRFWPSLVGGYLFGFSAYEIGHVEGELHLTAIFVLPLIALVIVRRFEGQVTRRRFTIELGLLLALQVYLATEVTVTLTVVLALALVVGYAFGRARRPDVVALVKPIALGYVVAGLLVLPLIYHALSKVHQGEYQPPNEYTADVLNFVVPTRLEAAGAGWAQTIVKHFPANLSEQGALIGLPLLVIIAMYARRAWATARGRFLLVLLAVTVYITLGPELTVFGHNLVPLPTPFGHAKITLPGRPAHDFPIFDNVLPVRFAAYVALGCAVIAAYWMTSTGHRTLRWLLPALAILLLVPNPSAGTWSTSYSVPSFFAEAAYRTCLGPNENVLPQPIGQSGQATLWQALDAFRFGLAGGRLQTSPPSALMHPPWIRQITVGYSPAPNQLKLLKQYISLQHVTSVIVDPRQAAIWTPTLDRIAKPARVGGVILYRVAPAAGRVPCS